MKNLLALNKTKLFYAMILTSLIQQILVASSSVWIVEVTEKVGEQGFVLWLSIYLISLLLPYVPGGLASVLLGQWILETQQKVFNRISKFQSNLISLWPNSENENKTQAILIRESPSYTESFNYWVYNLWDSFLNFALSIVVIASLVDLKILIFFVLGFGLSFLVIKMNAVKLENLADRNQSNELTLSSLNQRYWDNVVLNNSMNRNHFLGKFKNSIFKLKRSRLRLDGFNQLVSILLANIGGIPVLLFMAYKVVKLPPESPLVLATLFLIPRVFQVINSSHFFLWQTMQWASFKSRRKNLEKTLRELNSADLGSRVNGIEIQDAESGEIQKVSSADQIEGLRIERFRVDCRKKGRLKVAGPNGSGKSSFLLSLKERLQQKAFYLPAKFDLDFPEMELRGSTGQNLIKVLENLEKKSELPTLLLDEWSANLDTKNQSKMSELIDRLSKRTLVVEVCH